jgi:hypothetical protein
MRRPLTAALVAVLLALTLTGSAEATPATLSVSATVLSKTIGQEGGKVTLKVTVTNATECVFTSAPTIAGFNGRMKCAKGTFLRLGQLGKNSGKTRTVHLKVTASNAVATVGAQSSVKQSGKAPAPVKVPTTGTTTPTTIRSTSTTPTTTTTTTATTIPPTTTTIPSAIAGLDCTSICAYALSSPLGAVIFSWTPVPGAGQYGVQWFFSGGFQSIVLGVEPGLPPTLWVNNGQDYVEWDPVTQDLCNNGGNYVACPVGTAVSFEVESAPARAVSKHPSRPCQIRLILHRGYHETAYSLSSCCTYCSFGHATFSFSNHQAVSFG